MRELSKGAVFRRRLEVEFEEYDGPEALRRRFVDVIVYPRDRYFRALTDFECVNLGTKCYAGDEPTDDELRAYAREQLQEYLRNDDK